MRYVWRTPPARRAIDALSAGEALEYDRIEFFLSEFPFPIRGTSLVQAHTLFGIAGYRYFDDIFPYVIFYEASDDAVLIRLVMPAATRRTPL